jgi:hypothetical protein
MKKEVKAVIQTAIDAGFTLDRFTGTGHYKLTHDNGDTLVIPSTPSRGRWKQNALAAIKRAQRKERP